LKKKTRVNQYFKQVVILGSQYTRVNSRVAHKIDYMARLVFGN